MSQSQSIRLTDNQEEAVEEAVKELENSPQGSIQVNVQGGMEIHMTRNDSDKAQKVRNNPDKFSRYTSIAIRGDSYLLYAPRSKSPQHNT